MRKEERPGNVPETETEKLQNRDRVQRDETQHRSQMSPVPGKT